MIEITGLPDDPWRFFFIFFVAGLAAVAAAKLYGLFFMRWKTPFRVGEAMNVNRAEVVEWANGKGYVSAGGELWRATSSDPLQPGDAVAVLSVNGLSLQVKKETR
ncbi:NfeD family protein [Hyphococcus sp.]|jgi:membrane-bound ClpP family serine protease|uniref:NfeD family protein n=1 Tax=Hyphococcus sp. TaxID=2038636 RepID=UPI003D0D59EF